MYWNREAYLDHLCFVHSEREMITELFGLLLGTEERWRREGATKDEINLTAFSWDRAPLAHATMDKDPRSGSEETVLEETEARRVVRDRFGRRTVLPKKVATIPLPQDFPVAEPEDWEQVRDWFRPDPERVDESALARCARARQDGSIIRVSIWGAYDILRQLMGDEEACIAVLEEPDFVAEVLSVIGDMQEACIRKITQALPVDVLFVHEDFAGKSGPLVGPNVVSSLFNPYYRRMWACVQPAGARIFDLDSDGFIDPVVDALLEGGINCLHPVEPGAGSDIVRLRKRYGKNLILRGGIDKFALTRGQAAIDAELEYRLDPLLRGGGTMFGLDHRIPDGVSIAAYRYYATRLREILGLPDSTDDEPGWCRMA